MPIDIVIKHVTLVTDMLQGDGYEISYFNVGRVEFQNKDKNCKILTHA
jgi:hypothetical protein